MRRRIALVIFLLLAFTAGFIGSRFMPGDWYAQLDKPPFNPPNWIFAPVWTALYAIMAVAAWRVWLRTKVDAAIGLWLAQLVLNTAWSWLFFGRHSLGGGLVEIVALLALIVATTVAFWRRDRTAGWMMLPYVGWVAFASVLNASLWYLNAGG
jgi:translocator protein